MLISTQTTLALRCPSCGKMDFYALSRFSVGRGRSARILCECGTCLVNITAQTRQVGRKSLCLQVECIMCEKKHIINCRTADLWSKKVITLTCENTGVEMGFVGPRELVVNCVKRVNRSIRDMAEEMGCDKYFLNPEIMYQVLDLLRQMSEESLVSCGCGSGHLEVEVFPDRVELNCPYCSAVGVVFAETVKDLQWVHNMKEVHLEAHSYRYLDEKRLRRKSPGKK